MSLMKFNTILRAPADDAGAGGGGAGGGPGSSAPGADPWHKGMDAASLGVVQDMKWADLPAAEAAKNAVAEWRKLRDVQGHVTDYIKKPKAGDAASEAAFYEGLGVPKEAKDYKLDNVKFKDGTALDEAFSNRLRATAHKLHIPSEALPQLASDLVSFMEEADGADAAERQQRLTTERAALDKNWGANKERNLVIAKDTARVLGIKPEAIAAIEETAGYAAVMEMMLNIGTKIGEDKFVTGGAGGGGGGPMSREQAAAKISELNANADWRGRYFKNGISGPEWKEMHTLQQIASGIVDEHNLGR